MIHAPGDHSSLVKIEIVRDTSEHDAAHTLVMFLVYHVVLTIMNLN